MQSTKIEAFKPMPVKARAWDTLTKQLIYQNNDYDLDDLLYSWRVLTLWTGLVDFIGKEVYEGDILEGLKGKHKVVRFKDGAFRLMSSNRSPKMLLNSKKIHNGRYRVVGNIFENDELLNY